jgi:DNA polymerase V
MVISALVLFFTVKENDIAAEMADDLALQLVDQGLVAKSLTLGVGYRASAEERCAIFSATAAEGRAGEHGVRMRWGEFMENGTVRFGVPTNSRAAILGDLRALYERVATRGRAVHRLMMSVNGVEPEGAGQQLDLFQDPVALARERRRQEAVSAVKRKFGKNALLKGIDLLPEATQRERNSQIGGHRSGA